MFLYTDQSVLNLRNCGCVISRDRDGSFAETEAFAVAVGAGALVVVVRDVIAVIKDKR